MPANPAKLNALQLRTLTLLQEIAKHPMYVTEDEASGEAFIEMLPPQPMAITFTSALSL